MADRTNVPGALVIRGAGVNITLSPPWRRVMAAVQSDTGLTQTEIVRRAGDRHPQLGLPDATRLWMTEFFLLGRMPERAPDFRVPLWPYEWKNHTAEPGPLDIMASQ